MCCVPDARAIACGFTLRTPLYVRTVLPAGKNFSTFSTLSINGSCLRVRTTLNAGTGTENTHKKTGQTVSDLPAGRHEHRSYLQVRDVRVLRKNLVKRWDVDNNKD